ncbi:MAG: N-acetylmuramoyl-L-alanine amidase [bacterium]|nr:N-acetylmuramoyl-L-alanine amidase [bacterium]
MMIKWIWIFVLLNTLFLFQPDVTSLEKSGIKTIIIDPGHGGNDTGGVGKQGLLEKDVTLDIAKRLQKVIEGRLSDVRVLLTRDGDYFLSIDERVGFANHRKGDLFISIHTNASFSQDASGFEVYYFSPLESDLDSIQQEFIDEGIKLAGLIQKKVVNRLKIRDMGIKGCYFLVLKDVMMPAVVIETAFITNPSEEDNLKSEGFKTDLVSAICDAIQEDIR